MTTNAIYGECGSHWPQQVSTMVTTQWLQHDHTVSFLVKCVACETSPLCVASGSYFRLLGLMSQTHFRKKKKKKWTVYIKAFKYCEAS